MNTFKSIQGVLQGKYLIIQEGKTTFNVYINIAYAEINTDNGLSRVVVNGFNQFGLNHVEALTFEQVYTLIKEGKVDNYKLTNL